MSLASLRALWVTVRPWLVSPAGVTALVIAVVVFLSGSLAGHAFASRIMRADSVAIASAHDSIVALRDRDHLQAAQLRALADSQARHRAADSARDADFEQRADALDRRAEAYAEEKQAALEQLAERPPATPADGTTAAAVPDSAPAAARDSGATIDDEGLRLIASLRAALGECRGRVIAEREGRASDAALYQQRVDSLLKTKDDEARWRDTIITHQDNQLHPHGFRRVWQAVTHVVDAAKVPLAVVGGVVVGRAIR